VRTFTIYAAGKAEKLNPKNPFFTGWSGLRLRGSPFKVGFTGNVERRLQSLSNGLPHPLALAGLSSAWERPDAKALEIAALDALSRHRLRGEWFDLPLEDLHSILGKVVPGWTIADPNTPDRQTQKRLENWDRVQREWSDRHTQR
jgi:hypothetical protein